MTSTDRDRDPKRPAGGYRGTLPARDDRLARTWLIIMGIIFVSIFVLAFIGVPSRLIPDPTPVPVPTLAPTPAETEAETDGAEEPTEPAPSPTG
ncbi:MAG TPA: hypothetical protein VM253_06030 [Candidatus Limnocylindrales bacterium]|nr:hypothetical protein [Candidatus Limnocylindrales bacterium]